MSDNKSNTWPERLDNCLRIAEAIIVLAITVAIFGLIVVEFWSVLLRGDSPPRQQRVESMLKTLNDNWKASLLLLVPLFYRTIRMFLEKVKRAWGMEIEPEKQSTKGNPPSPAVEEDGARA